MQITFSVGLFSIIFFLLSELLKNVGWNLSLMINVNIYRLSKLFYKKKCSYVSNKLRWILNGDGSSLLIFFFVPVIIIVYVLRLRLFNETTYFLYYLLFRTVCSIRALGFLFKRVYVRQHSFKILTLITCCLILSSLIIWTPTNNDTIALIFRFKS